MRPEEIRPDLEQFAREQFAFLVQEKGFHAGPDDKTRGFITLRYFGERIGFEVYVEFFDPTIIERVFLIQQDTPRGASSVLQPKARRYRVLLGALRNTLGIADKRIDQIEALSRTKQPWDRRVFEDIIRLDSELVRDYIDALGQLPTDILFPPPASQSPDSSAQV